MQAYDNLFKWGVLFAIATIVALIITKLICLRIPKNSNSEPMQIVTTLLFLATLCICILLASTGGDDTHQYSLTDNKDNTNIVFKPKIANEWAYRFDLFKHSVKTTSYYVFYKSSDKQSLYLGRMEHGKFYPAKNNDAGYAFAKLGNKVLQRHLTKNFLANAWFKTNAHESTLTSQKDHVKYKLVIPVKEHKLLIN